MHFSALPHTYAPPLTAHCWHNVWQILWFIHTSVGYIENLDLSQTEVDEAVRKSTNYLLSKTLSGTMSDVIRSSNLTLQQLTQISVNTSCLQDACKELEDVISKATHSVGDDLHVSSLYGASAFKDARAAVEEKLLNVLQVSFPRCTHQSRYSWGGASLSLTWPREPASPCPLHSRG